MKKFLLISFVAVFMFPAVASAAWWNPLSWKVFSFFHKKEIAPQVQVIDLKQTSSTVQEIKLPQKQTANLNTSTVINPVVKKVVTPPSFVTKSQTIVQPISQPIVQPLVQPQPIINTEPNLVQKQNYDQALNQLILEKRQYISTFEANIRDTDEFASTIRTVMQKYPNEYTIQQSGQELLNENNNYASISRKLINIVNTMISKYSSYLGLGISPKAEDFTQINQQYSDYYQQSKTSDSRIKYLMNNFVSVEKAVLIRLNEQVKQQIQSLQNSNNISSPVASVPLAPPCDPQIESALSELQTTLIAIQNKPVAMSIIEGKKQVAIQGWEKANPSVFSNQTCVNELNSILASY